MASLRLPENEPVYGGTPADPWSGMRSTGGRIGGLGGLGGLLNSPSGGNFLQAAGMALLSSPRNAPFQNFGPLYNQINDNFRLQQAFDAQMQDRDSKRSAMEGMLISAGASPEQARTLSASP